MPGLVPGIHVLECRPEGVDRRNKPGHDAAPEQPPIPLLSGLNIPALDEGGSRWLIAS